MWGVDEEEVDLVDEWLRSRVVGFGDGGVDGVGEELKCVWIDS